MLMESGMHQYASPAAARAERLARAAYQLANLEPDCEEGLGWMLRRLIGYTGVAIDDRVPPGRAVVEFTSSALRPESHPSCVNVAGRQRTEDKNMALAMGCAIYIACYRGEQLDAEALEQLTLAIALPADAVTLAQIDGLTPAEIAMRYRLDEIVVHKRLRILRGARESGECPAITSEALAR